MAVTTLHGRFGGFYLQGSGATAVKLLQARSWKITIDKAEDEDNAMGDAWVTQKVGLLKWTGNFAGNFDLTDTTAWDAAISTSPKNVYFYPQIATPTAYYYGQAYAKMDLEVSLANVARYTADFVGEGPLTRV